MTQSDTICDVVESTTTTEGVTVTVPDRVVLAVAARLEGLDDPDEDDARDLALDHVDVDHRLVTTDGEDVATAALERVSPPRMDPIEFGLETDALEAVDEAAEAAGVSRAEWIRSACESRIATDGSGEDVTLEYDEDGVDAIEVDATAELDYATDPERPLSVELELPAGVVDEADLDDVLGAVSIEARIADE